MFAVKLLVFSALVALTLSAAIKREETEKLSVCQEEMARYKKCFANIKDKMLEILTIQTETDHVTMQNITQIFRDDLECLGKVTCGEALYMKYITEATVFAEEKMYGSAYDCVRQSIMSVGMNYCASLYIPKEQLASGSFTTLFLHGKEAGKCVAKNLDGKICTSNDRDNFYQGFLALSNFLQVIAGMPKHADGTISYDWFDKTFDPEMFIHEHL